MTACPKTCLRRSWWLAAVVMLLCGCTTNPITGRSQFAVVSEESAISGSASAYSNMMGQLFQKNKIEIETPRAGYDPRAAVSLWKKMAAEGGGPPEFLSTHPAPENRMERLATLVAQVEPYYQKAKETRDTAQIPTFIGVAANERALDNISREEYAAKIAAEGQVMTFMSGDFEKFKRGETVFTCGVDCAFGYNFQKGDWKQLYEKKSWRDLAVSLLRVGYPNDLSYFLLAEAANGLGLKEAGKTYYTRALEARKDGKTCDGTFNTCEGFDIPKLVQAALQQ